MFDCLLAIKSKSLIALYIFKCQAFFVYFFQFYNTKIINLTSIIRIQLSSHNHLARFMNALAYFKLNIRSKKTKFESGSPGLWEETHVPKVVVSNPGTLYWMDIFSHLFVVQLQCLFEKTKTYEKEAGHFLKRRDFSL